MKKNSFLFGSILGLIAPLLGMLIYYLLKFYPTYSFGEFTHVILSEKTILSGLSTFALFVNVVLLTFYLNNRRDETAKGIFTVSCIYAIAAFLIRLLH